jgi:hypothetical protein
MEREYRVNRTVSLRPAHDHWLEVQSNKTGLSPSEIVRLLIEEHSDHHFERSGFGWEIKGPKWKEEDHG